MEECLAFELSFAEISRRLNISVSTCRRIYKLFEITGDISPKLCNMPRKYMRKLNDYEELFIVGLILENPSLHLSELCKLTHNISSIEVSPSTVCRLLHRHGFTHKGVRQIALQRSFELRGLFMAQVLLYDKDKFVWLNETVCNNRNYIRKYGYAIRGETPHCHTMIVRGTRISVIAAIASDGLVAWDCTTSTMDCSRIFNSPNAFF